MPETYEWKWLVWEPMGGGPREIGMHESFMRSDGARFQVTPEGNCVEGTFNALGRHFGVRPLRALQHLGRIGGVWTPLFYGEVRVGGNQQDDVGETYTLRSLLSRLKECQLSPGFTAPQQAAHLTIRAALQDVINSGQLGTPSLIEYDEALVPDLGYDYVPVRQGNEQDPGSLIELVVQAGLRFNVDVAFGVRPDRKFFAVPKRRDVLTVTPAELARAETKAPVAETPCTAVLWYIGRDLNGDWVTHRSESPDAAEYGPRIKRQEVHKSVDLWQVVPAAYAQVAKDASTTMSGGAMPDSLFKDPPIPPKPEYYFDQNETIRTIADTQFNIVNWDNPDPTRGRLTLTPLDGGPIDRLTVRSTGYGQQFIFTGDGATETWELDQRSFVLASANPADGNPQEGIPVYADLVGSAMLPDSVTGAYLEIATKPWLTSENQPFQTATTSVVEFRADRIDRGLLDGLAKYHFVSPAQDPADIPLSALRAPADLPGLVDTPGFTRPAAAYEYRMTAREGVRLWVMVGQAEDPAKLAMNSLIKRRDTQATLNALNAQT